MSGTVGLPWAWCRNVTVATLSIVCLISLSAGCRRKPPVAESGAREYYYQLLKARGYSIDHSEATSREIARVAARDPRFSEFTEQELTAMAQAGGPDGKFGPLWDDLSRYLPQRYRPPPSDIFVAEF